MPSQEQRPSSPTSPSRKRVRSSPRRVKSALTLSQVNLTTGVGFSGPCVGTTGAIPRLNFTGLCFQDSPLGVRLTDNNSAFPAGINVAATFDRRLMHTRGIAMGNEFRGKGVNVALGALWYSPFSHEIDARAQGR